MTPVSLGLSSTTKSCHMPLGSELVKPARVVIVGGPGAGAVHPFAFNPMNDHEFAGATFSPDGRTLYVNIQGPPGLTFAIWGPWERG